MQQFNVCSKFTSGQLFSLAHKFITKVIKLMMEASHMRQMHKALILSNILEYRNKQYIAKN